MKKQILTAIFAVCMPLAVMAQYEADTATGGVSRAGREGLSIDTKKGDFVFTP